jgi:hypothetical protein
MPVNNAFLNIMGSYYVLLSKHLIFHAVFLVHKSYLIFMASLSQGTAATGGEKAWCSKKTIGKIGKKTTKRKKTGKRSTANAHSWGGGELHGKEKGKERKEERKNVKTA